MYRIRKTCLEMLYDRGYLITEVRMMLLVIPYFTSMSEALLCDGLTVLLHPALQEDREATREQFMDRFGPEVRREDLTIMASKVVRRSLLSKSSPLNPATSCHSSALHAVPCMQFRLWIVLALHVPISIDCASDELRACQPCSLPCRMTPPSKFLCSSRRSPRLG
jgi:hypothetical protein